MKFYPKGSIIFNYGLEIFFISISQADKADNFFLIIKGEINFFLPKNFERLHEDIIIKQEQVAEYIWIRFELDRIN